MAGTAGRKAFDLESLLIKEGHSFTFFQAVRLLLLMRGDDASCDLLEGKERKVRIRPSLELNFPESDVDKIEKLPDDKGYRMTATFLGLYGVTSPLPTFYAEDLLREFMDDKSAQRDFLDIIHYTLYPIFYKAWTKYRVFLKVAEDGDEGYMGKLFSVIGLGDRSIRDKVVWPERLIKYSGLLTQFPRSAMGLKTMLSDALGGVDVDVIQCHPCATKIPDDQRLILGGEDIRLGYDSYLGQEIEDRMSGILIKIGPLSGSRFQSLLPGEEDHDWLKSMITFYLMEPVEATVELILDGQWLSSVSFGFSCWNKLGLDTWIYSGQSRENVSASLKI